MLRRLSITLLLLGVSACNRPDQGTTVTINGSDGAAGVDGNTGEVKIDLPGFKAAVKLPKMQFDADDFTMNGVHLYPGSTIDTVNVLGNDGKKDGGGLHLSFTSPTTPDKAQLWFEERLTKAGFTVHGEGTDLVGTTDEKKPFRLDLAPAGETSKGTITIGG